MHSDGAATGCRDDVSRFYTIQEERRIAVRCRIAGDVGADLKPLRMKRYLDIRCWLDCQWIAARCPIHSRFLRMSGCTEPSLTGKFLGSMIRI